VALTSPFSPLDAMTIAANRDSPTCLTIPAWRKPLPRRRAASMWCSDRIQAANRRSIRAQRHGPSACAELVHQSGVTGQATRVVKRTDQQRVRMATVQATVWKSRSIPGLSLALDTSMINTPAPPETTTRVRVLVPSSRDGGRVGIDSVGAPPVKSDDVRAGAPGQAATKTLNTAGRIGCLPVSVREPPGELTEFA
jgi:hypothetical protein